MGIHRNHAMYGPAVALRPCAGVLCPVALECVRYQHVDGTRIPSVAWLASCGHPSTTVRPAFISVDFIGPPEPHHFHITRQSIHSPGRHRPPAPYRKEMHHEPEPL